eukprot:g7896.t2
MAEVEEKAAEEAKEEVQEEKAQAPEEPAEASKKVDEAFAKKEAPEPEAKPIYLAGRAFANRTELAEHVKKIQENGENGSKCQLQ